MMRLHAARQLVHRPTRLKEEHRYPHTVSLPRHEEQVGNRDPRRVWIYDCGMEFTSVEDQDAAWPAVAGVGASANRIYRFDNEADCTMFVLRWGGQCGN